MTPVGGAVVDAAWIWAVVCALYLRYRFGPFTRHVMWLLAWRKRWLRNEHRRVMRREMMHRAQQREYAENQRIARSMAYAHQLQMAENAPAVVVVGGRHHPWDVANARQQTTSSWGEYTS